MTSRISARTSAPISALPPVGSKWKDRDSRRKRTIEVIRHDLDKKRIRIHCIETDVLTWAKPSRFSGKDQSYMPLGK